MQQSTHVHVHVVEHAYASTVYMISILHSILTLIVSILTPELQALAEIIGPYGIRFVGEKLMEQVYMYTCTCTVCTMYIILYRAVNLCGCELVAFCRENFSGLQIGNVGWALLCVISQEIFFCGRWQYREIRQKSFTHENFRLYGIL